MLVLLFCVALCECLVFCGVGVAVLSLCAPGVESWVCRQPGAICGVLAVFWVWLFKHEVVLQSSVAVVHHSISDVLCPWLHIRGDVTLRRHAKTSCEDIARRHPAKTSREDVTRGRHAGTSREDVTVIQSVSPIAFRSEYYDYCGKVWMNYPVCGDLIFVLVLCILAVCVGCPGYVGSEQ